MLLRRDFLKLAGLTSLGISRSRILNAKTFSIDVNKNIFGNVNIFPEEEKDLSIIGLYGPWANSLDQNKLPSLSFRRSEFTKIEPWRKAAKQRLTERMGIPEIGGLPKVTVNKQYTYDGLQIEEISWQLAYGRPTEAIILKPMNAKGKLPAILAFHDHAANKYFGCHKITKTSDNQHPLMKYHQENYYTGLAWANEVAKRGYVVMVPDAFAFASRRVMLQDVPSHLRNGVNDGTDDASITAYNKWASDHEPIMAKSLFCAGTSWPAVFFAEDKKALDILCTRADVDTTRIGCGGLSGGGLRTTFMAGLDARIKCAVNVGFTTTWSDFLLNKSYTHTWMVYVPMLPNELNFPEIIGLRVPLATLVLNDSEDQLYTLNEMKKAEKILSEIFAKAGAEDRFKCSYYPGLHKFDANMQTEAFNWFDRWLKS